MYILPHLEIFSRIRRKNELSSHALRKRHGHDDQTRKTNPLRTRTHARPSLFLPMYLKLNTALECNLGRLNKIEFEDVFNRSPIIEGPNAHELYMRQFN